MIKIIINDKVYIPVSELKTLGIDENLLKNDCPECITKCPKYGEIIAESALNAECLIRNRFNMKRPVEITKVHSLSSEIKNAKAVLPLKQMVLSGFCKTEEELDMIMANEEKKTMHEIMDTMTRTDKFPRFFNDELELCEDLKKQINAGENKDKLQVQCITEIKDGEPHLLVFVAGKGIFYADGITMNETEWGSAEISDSHVKVLDDSSGEYIEENIETDRDFRDYDPIDNIVWCLKNADINNDFCDEITCTKGAVYVSVPIQFLMKIINAKAFQDTVYISGVPEIAYSSYISEKDAVHN